MPATSAVKPGIAGAVYRNTGTYASPTWAEITLVRDVAPGFPWDLVDASTRASRAKLSAKTQADLKVQLTVRADDADAGYIALFDASVSPTQLPDLMILDGKITVEGAMGLRAEWNVNFSSQSQGAGDIVYTTFDLAPGWTTNGPPKSVKMGASSAPAFTAF
jgi:hypothetical protein